MMAEKQPRMRSRTIASKTARAINTARTINIS